LADFIYADEKTVSMLDFILSITDTQLKTTNQMIADCKEVGPDWFQEAKLSGTFLWNRQPYFKAKSLPTEKFTHIACQFDARTRVPWSKGVSDAFLDRLAATYPGRLVNIGDLNRRGMSNEVGASLARKFEVIATAQSYIGIDSGLTHMSLMTNTPTHIAYSDVKPWFFYPDQSLNFISDKTEQLAELGL
jgi:ADP-heptose:LPS heptosyltransferase